MEIKERDLDLELLKAVTSGAPPAEVQKLGREAKRRLWKQWLALMTQGGMVDYVVSRYAPDPQWVWGIQDPDNPVRVAPVISPTKPGTTGTRKERVLAYAQQMLEEGQSTVTSMAIAERLKQEGDPGNMRNLTVAVGNTLSRNGWHRVGEGEYEPEVNP